MAWSNLNSSLDENSHRTLNFSRISCKQNLKLSTELFQDGFATVHSLTPSLLSQASHETRLCINTIDLPIGPLTEEKIQNRKAVMEASPLCCANGHFRLVIVLPATPKYLLIIEMINFISTPSPQRLLRYYRTICHVFTCLFSLSMYLVASWTTRTERECWRKHGRRENLHKVLICIL